MYPPPPPPIPDLPANTASSSIINKTAANNNNNNHSYGANHPPPFLSRSQPSSSSTDTAGSVASNSSSSVSGNPLTLRGLRGQSSSQSWATDFEDVSVGPSAGRGTDGGAFGGRGMQSRPRLDDYDGYGPCMRMERGALAGKNMR